MYEQLWVRDRRRRLITRGALAVAAYMVGRLTVSFEFGLFMALIAAGGHLCYQWWPRFCGRVWRKGQRGDRRMARLLRFTLEQRGYRVLSHRSVPGHMSVDQIVIGPAGMWLISNQAWSPDTDISAYVGKLFIGRESGSTLVATLNDTARAAASLVSRELRTEVTAAPLIAVHSGRLPRGGLVTANGVRLLRAYRVPRWISRQRLGNYTREQIEDISRAAAWVMPADKRAMGW